MPQLPRNNIKSDIFLLKNMLYSKRKKLKICFLKHFSLIETVFLPSSHSISF